MQYNFKDAIAVFDAGSGDLGAKSLCTVALSTTDQSPATSVTGISLVPNLVEEKMPLANEIAKSTGLPINRKQIESAQGALYQRARTQQRLFRDATEKAACRPEWRTIQGSQSELLAATAELAMSCDVIVTSQPDAERDQVWSDTIEKLVTETGRPLIVVPREDRGPFPGDRVLVAWDGSQHVTRAVHDALPILRNSKEVMIAVATEEAERDGDALRQLKRLAICLESHDISTTSHIIDLQEGQTISGALRDFAHSSSVTLVVMGAHGGSWLAENVFGSTTKNTIHKLGVPVFLAH